MMIAMRNRTVSETRIGSSDQIAGQLTTSAAYKSWHLAESII